mmetsp:Transcript_11376/g.29292  ORF Transcript_11376/g.29292 Transcript_11376/m.29292 type:complete len:249 (+) Transcript_11376:411-1157(+)
MEDAPLVCQVAVLDLVTVVPAKLEFDLLELQLVLVQKGVDQGMERDGEVLHDRLLPRQRHTRDVGNELHLAVFRQHLLVLHQLWQHGCPQGQLDVVLEGLVLICVVRVVIGVTEVEHCARAIQMLNMEPVHTVVDALSFREVDFPDAAAQHGGVLGRRQAHDERLPVDLGLLNHDVFPWRLCGHARVVILVEDVLHDLRRGLPERLQIRPHLSNRRAALARLQDARHGAEATAARARALRDGDPNLEP